MTRKPSEAQRLRATKGSAEATSILLGKHKPYFTQTVAVSTEFEGMTRKQIFTQLLAGKKVLHVGYADWPITDPQQNLHVQLDKICAKLDGIDPHTEADRVIGPLVTGKLFHSWNEVKDTYDAALVPEVMEHVDNVRDFLEQLNRAPVKRVIITVPDATQCYNGHFDFDKDKQTVIEVVHPDHNYWFSPYTLSNLVRKYTDWTIKGLWQVNNISIMIIADKLSANSAPMREAKKGKK